MLSMAREMARDGRTVGEIRDVLVRINVEACAADDAGVRDACERLAEVVVHELNEVP
jgi:hypothetical protein